MNYFKPYYSCIFVLFLFISCEEQISPLDQRACVFIEPETKSSLDKEYIYNVSANVWMFKQEDPYELSNLRQLARENNIDTINIVPTHYAIKLFPRNEKELNDLIFNNKIQTSFIPFGYTLVPINQLNKTCANLDNYRIYKEEEKYFIDDGYYSSQIPMPVIYASWPISCDLPSNYDYIIEYEVCLPSTDSQSNDGQFFSKLLRGSRNRTLTGNVISYDYVLCQYVPVKKLKLQLRYGLSVFEAITDDNGYFFFSGNINDSATINIVFDDSKFRITNNSLFSYVESHGTVLNWWGTSQHNLFSFSSEAVVIHRAANHFFYGDHEIVTPSSNYSLRINMKNTSGDGGFFYASAFSTPYIQIRIADVYTNAEYISNTLHELGHFNHYQKNGGFSNYNNVISLIKESYADYVAWYLSRNYYTDCNSGLYNPSWESFLAKNNQVWTVNMNSDYSPLFIDLVDDYNQHTSYSSNYVNDMVSDVPHYMIPSIVSNKKTWQEMKQCLFGYVGMYYTITEFNAFISYYDDYCSGH